MALKDQHSRLDAAGENIKFIFFSFFFQGLKEKRLFLFVCFFFILMPTRVV